MLPKHFAIIFILLLAGNFSYGQSSVKPASNAFSKKDSIDAINELLADLNFLFDSLPQKQKSYGNISVGTGLGYFTLKNTSAVNPLYNKWYYSTSGSYTHKSGFGLSLKGVMMDDGRQLNLFQTILSSSYDHLKSNKWTWGTSYTHYFIKDSLPFQTSPLVNELYAYAGYKKSFLRPTLGINYAVGTSKTFSPATSTSPAINATTTINDVAFIFSIQHFWLLQNVLTSKDYLTLGPTLMAVAGTSKYGTNLSMGTLGKNIKNYNANFNGNGNAHGKAKVKKKKKNNNSPGAPPTTVQLESNTGFNMQGGTLILGAGYGLKQLYIQPQLMLDVTIPAAAKQFNILFNAVVGVNF